MTKPFKARYIAALKARDATMCKVYAAARSNCVVFSECRKLASLEDNAAYDAAFSSLYNLDYEAAQSGKAYQAREAARAAYYDTL